MKTLWSAWLLVWCGSLLAQEPGAEPFDMRSHYEKTEHQIEMRDDVKLFTIVYAPRDTTQTYPVLLFRTPYSIAPYGPASYRQRLGPSELFDRDGFIFVFQDVRGTFRSEGQFEVMKPLSVDQPEPTGIDESTDTYDTIEWILKNVPHHNGRVGQWGISYPGWQTVMGMIDAHPNLVASSPQASPSDMFIGDDWHHNGAFRLMYAFSWLNSMTQAYTGPDGKRLRPVRYGTPWGYRFFLELGPVANVNKHHFKRGIQAWNDFVDHGTYDDYWQRQVATNYLDDVDHAVLHVAGWFDAEDFYGPLAIYRTLESRMPDNDSTLVVGPWSHGGWSSPPGRRLGCIDFGSETARKFQEEILFPFFRDELKGEGDRPRPEVVAFETGSNTWRTYDSWPPAAVVPKNLYFREGGKLRFEPPVEEGADNYVSDPEKPVPFSAEVRVTQGHLWMIEDQRFAATRPDVLVYESDVLTEDLTLCGPIEVKLHASTTGTDADWIVKLIDVFPGNTSNDPECDTPMGDFQMLLSGEIFRGKFRSSFEEPEPIEPGVPTLYEFSLPDRHHTFLAGHRIMVQVHSTWFPVYDRNPQSFVDIYRAEESDFQSAAQTVHRSPAHASQLVLPVLPR